MEYILTEKQIKMLNENFNPIEYVRYLFNRQKGESFELHTWKKAFQLFTDLIFKYTYKESPLDGLVSYKVIYVSQQVFSDTKYKWVVSVEPVIDKSKIKDLNDSIYKVKFYEKLRVFAQEFLDTQRVMGLHVISPIKNKRSDLNHIRYHIINEDFLISQNKTNLSEATNYTEDEILRIAKQYKTPREFRNKSQYVSKLAYQDKNLWDRVTQHMKKRPHVKRTEEDVYTEALKYDYLKDFIANSENAYRKAIRLGILDNVTKHMKVLDGLSKRVIYVYEFPDNSVYVGLTHSVEKREKQHKERGSVAEHFRETKLIPTLKIISDDYVDPTDAQKMEACTVETYRQNGWTILNKAKTGSLGACKVFWTRDRVKNLTRNLTYWKEFERYGGAYDAAYRNNWLNDDDITGHLIRKKKYTEEDIMNTLDQFGSYSEFRQYDNKKLYQAAKERKLLPNIKQWFETNRPSDNSVEGID